MFYTTDANDHGFPHDPFKAIVTPRPIGWIGSIDKDGIANLAPHSYFNAISDTPRKSRNRRPGRPEARSR